VVVGWGQRTCNNRDRGAGLDSESTNAAVLHSPVSSHGHRLATGSDHNRFDRSHRLRVWVQKSTHRPLEKRRSFTTPASQELARAAAIAPRSCGRK
jgi:hypothetical protein